MTKERLSSRSSNTSASRSKSGSRGRTAVRLLDKAGSTTESVPPEEVRQPVRKKRGDDVRLRILEAALECFGAFGFEGTSTRAVAERAGVTHTLVLYHFLSKDQLWIATMERALSNYVGELRAHLEAVEGQTARAALSTFIERFVRMSATYPQIHRILTMESNQKTERLHFLIENYLRSHFLMVKDLIRRGQAEGVVRECDPARLYYHIIGAGGTPFTIATEYLALTGRDVFSEAEILRNIAFIYEVVFI